MNKLILLVILAFACLSATAQAVPAKEENIPYLITFGKGSDPSWGDDDYSQTFFFVVPKNNTSPIFLRIYDPETGGKVDELKGSANSKTQFSVYGGTGAITNKDAQSVSPTGNYKSGTRLAIKTFSAEPKYDQKWYTFGPFNPSEGELVEEYGGYVFKLIADGLSGNDGNLYKYFMSNSNIENIPIEGGNAFTFEYSFRLHDDVNQISHIYPYIDELVTSVKQANFDWDNDGFIRVISVARKKDYFKTSGDNTWAKSEHPVYEAEKGNSLDVQFLKRRPTGLKNNNVVFYITNQYGEFMPFYTVPIGGIPKYNYKIKVKPINE